MWHSWQRTACLWLSALALILMIIAYATPGWLIYDVDSAISTTDDTVYLGLWYAVTCIQQADDTEVCDSVSYAKAEKLIVAGSTGASVYGDAYDALVAYEVEATLGLFACIVGVFCVFIAFTYWCESWYCCSIRYYMISAAVAFLISGILVWIPTGEFARVNDLLDNYSAIKLGVPYSVILMAIAGIIAFLILFILVWMLCTDTQRHHSEKRRYSDSDYGDNHYYNKYDDRHTRPYTIAEPPRYEKPYRPSHRDRHYDYQESRHSNHRNHYLGHSKRHTDYHQNWMYDNSLPRRSAPHHYDEYPRRHEHPSPYRGLSPYDRSLRY